MEAGDSPRLHDRYRQQEVTLDTVYPDERAMTVRLEQLLGADVRKAVVKRTDLVRDQMVVDVRYRLHPTPQATPRPQGAPDAEMLPERSDGATLVST